MATKDIFNFVEINEQIATGGQPTSEQFEAARDEGFKAVINLAPSDAENNALPNEQKLLEALGMDYYHIPIVWTEPRPEHFTAFCEAMKAVGDRKVLVHCAANYRVSAMLSSYAIKHLGWSVEQADGLVEKVWNSIPEYSMDDTWQAFIDATRA